MRYLLVFGCVFVLTGCGLFARNDVVSDVAIEDGNNVTATTTFEEDDFLSPIELESGDNTVILDLEARNTDPTITFGEEVITIEEGRVDKDPVVIDKTPVVIDTITNRVSPVTGPAIPEDEMREILNAELISNGETPRY